MRIQVVQDLICPWCYIGHHNLDQALEEWTSGKDVTVEVEWLPYQLDPLEPGAPPESFRERFTQRKGIQPAQMNGMFDRVTQAGAALGIHFRFDRIEVAVDTLPGHIAIAATPLSRQGELVSALHKAYFEDGKDIGATPEILAAATAAGLDEAELANISAALDDASLQAQIVETIREVQAAGITGVPYFIVDGKFGLSGGQPVDVFKQVFDQATEPALA
jgi:predicted DsbA family dithiol-disulfide isomerase